MASENLNDPDREVRPLPGCGIVTAVLLVVFCVAIGWIAADLVQMLRRGVGK